MAVGNTTTIVAQHSDDSWELAPACPFAPTSTNSVKDRSGRLWGWSGGKSCTFKAPVYDLWFSAPACPPSLPQDSAVKDKSGRAWGWFNGTSCAWRVRVATQAAAGPLAVAHRGLLQDCVLALLTHCVCLHRLCHLSLLQDARHRTLLAGAAPATATPAPNAANVAMPSVTPVAPNSAVPVVLLNAVQPSPAGGEALPAGDTVVTTAYGSGPDAVSCNLVQTQEPGTNLVRSQ
jgi:hypothetical protein